MKRALAIKEHSQNLVMWKQMQLKQSEILLHRLFCQKMANYHLLPDLNTYNYSQH